MSSSGRTCRLLSNYKKIQLLPKYLTLIRNKVNEDTTTSIARTGIKPICITKDPAVTTKEKIYKNYVR